jgi:sirohydrochlorin cobalto/nickelchelatase
MIYKTVSQGPDSKPTIPETLDQFREDNIDSLVVVPLFLTRGVHIDEDIPGILNLSSGQKKVSFQLKSHGIPLVLADPIGENPILADLMEESARKALALI